MFKNLVPLSIHVFANLFSLQLKFSSLDHSNRENAALIITNTKQSIKLKNHKSHKTPIKRIKNFKGRMETAEHVGKRLSEARLRASFERKRPVAR